MSLQGTDQNVVVCCYAWFTADVFTVSDFLYTDFEETELRKYKHETLMESYKPVQKDAAVCIKQCKTFQSSTLKFKIPTCQPEFKGGKKLEINNFIFFTRFRFKL